MIYNLCLKKYLLNKLKMKKEKLLNFMIAFLLTVIIFNYFVPKNDTAVVPTTLTFKSTSKNYTIPNLPILEISNNLIKNVTINTCKDITIKKDWNKVEWIKKTSPKFCTELNIKSKSVATINLEPLSKLFYNSWDYIFDLKANNKELSATFTQEEKWFWNNLLSTIFYAPVYNLFVLIINILPSHNLWLSIIIVTLIIRLLVLIPQHKMMVSSKKMQLIQPKIKEIQTKNKWDQAKIWMELLELYKKEWVNPMWSCLPLFIQLPILIVLYWTISGITSTANYYYLYWSLSSFDIRQINSNFLGLNLIKQEWKSGLILAIIIWLLQWLQIKMSLTIHTKKKDHWKIVEKDEKIDDPVSEFMPDPNVMNAFMLWWMPSMFAFSSYFFPSWVSIYWVIGTLFTLVQQIVVNKIWVKKELQTKDGNEIILSKKSN